MIVLYAIIVILGMYLVYHNRQKKGKPLPGPAGLPLLGSALDINDTNLVSKFGELAEQYGHVFGLNLFTIKTMSLNTEPALREVLTSEKLKRFTNDRATMFVGEKFLYGSQSISVQQDGFGAIHGNMRKGLTKGLHVYGQEGLKHFESNIMMELNLLNKRIEKMDNDDIEIVGLFRRSLTNTISIAMDGKPFDDDDPDIEMFWDYIDGINFFLVSTVNMLMLVCPVLRYLPGSKYKTMFDTAMNARAKLTQRYVVEQKASRAADKPRGLVDVLLEEQQNDIDAGREPTFTDTRVICTVLETVGAGILTTWSVLTSTILCLANHPNYQDRVYEELMTQIGPDREATHTDKHNCPLLEALELETHRLITVVPILAPRINNEDIDFQGYHVPKNTVIFGNIWHIHHDEKVWGDPWTFRPERFLDDSGQLLPRDHVYRKNWMAFGLGRRACIGEPFARSRYFLYLATLLRQWKFTPSPGRCGPCDPRQHEYFTNDFTIRPKHFYCKAERRKH